MRRALNRFAVVLGLVALATGAPVGQAPARADEEWTLLPQSEWFDEFSPRYTNGHGLFCDGDPTASLFDSPTIVSRVETDEESGFSHEIEYVQNEALVNFTASESAASISSLFNSLGVQVLGAWFEPDASDPETSMSWFHVEIGASSSYHNNVPGLVSYLGGLPAVESAGYNDCATLCGGLYDSSQNKPDDTLWFGDSYNNSTANLAQTHLGLYGGAWPLTSGVEFFSPNNNVVAVAVMDTGVDVDHDDFLTVPVSSVALAQDDLHTQIYTRAPCAAGTATAVRHSMSASMRTCAEGEVPLWEATPNPGPFQTGGSPAAGASHVTKALDLAKEWHGHGTAMAGIIGAAGNNANGMVSCGTRNVRVLPARMRMVKHRTVDIASAIKLTRALRKVYGSTLNANGEVTSQTDVRVVYMGFATDLKERDAAYSQLLRGMKRDRKLKNDRIWVAPASNNRRDSDTNLISYPAGILRDRADSSGSTASPGGNHNNPAMLGVSGVAWGSQGAQIDGNTNTYARRDPQNTSNFLVDTGVYGISAYVGWGTSTLDPRDDWYGVANAFTPSLWGIPTAGYMPYYVPSLPPNPTAYQVQSLSGRYAGSFEYTTTQVKKPDIPPGNSIAAAEVASLAGILMSKWGGSLPSGSEADRIVALIKVSTASGATSLGATTDRRRVAGPVHFPAALTGSP